jgi:hypothetical protein
MGSFNVACGVSRISMGGGRRAVLVPLLREKTYRDFHGSGGAMIISNDGISHTYSPFALPIFGEYNDYGVLDNIEENVNTKAIEKYYGCSIERFVEYICRPWDNRDKEKQKTFPDNPYSMFVHRDVYNNLSRKIYSEYGELDSAYASHYVNPYVLGLLGFVAGDDDEKRERYNTPYTHPEIPSLVVWSDGTYNEFEIDGKKLQTWIYHIKDFHKFLLEKKLFVPPIMKSFRKVSEYDIKFDEDLTEYNSRAGLRKLSEELKNRKEGEPLSDELTEKLKVFGTNISQYFQSLKKVHSVRSIFRFGNYYGEREDIFDELYGNVVNEPEFKTLLVGFRNFEHGMYGVNASYGPTWNGHQCGNHKATINLAKLVQKIVTKEIKARNE